MQELPDTLASEAARLLGRKSTPAKQAAARKNGKLGGRPKGYRMSKETRQKISEAMRMHAKVLQAEAGDLDITEQVRASEI